MRRFFLAVRREFDLPVVLVTHDLWEAYSLADTLVIYHQGRVVQSGPPDEVVQHPASPVVADLVNFQEFWAGPGLLIRSRLAGDAGLPVAGGLAASRPLRATKVLP